MAGIGLIPDRYASFLGECKNYQSSVGVTYVGKFCSLLQTTSIKTGILFSFHGISGREWSDGTGLVKKIYLQKEEESKRTVIIDFSTEDFRAILDGKNFFEIVDSKLVALRLDTSVADGQMRCRREPRRNLRWERPFTICWSSDRI